MAKKPKDEKPEPDDKEQSERFIETARNLEADETGEEFEDALEKIGNKKQKPGTHREP